MARLQASLELIGHFDRPSKGKLVVAFPSIYLFDEFYSHGRIIGQVLSLSHEMTPVLRVTTPDFYPEIPLQHIAPDQIDFVEANEAGTASLPEFEQGSQVDQIPHFTKMAYAEFLKSRDENFVLLTKPYGYSPAVFIRDYCRLYLKIAYEIGITEVYSLGTRLAEASPRGRLSGYATLMEAAEKLEKHGVGLVRNELLPYFTNVLLGVASEEFGMTGYRINSNHGEEPPYENSIKQMLDSLADVSGISYDEEVFDKVMDEWVSSLKLAGTDFSSGENA